MPIISITSVNFNSENFIRQCLDSIKLQTYQDFEMIIVDNASFDKSAEIISKEYPFVKLIKNKENAGYCKAQNTAIAQSKGAYIIALNLDIILDNHFLEEMVKAADEDPLIGSVAPKLLKLKSKIKTNIIDSLGHAIGKNRCAKNIGSGEKDTGQYDNNKFIFGVSGAAPLYKRKMLEDIKWGHEYLDEDFIYGYDDVDIDFRSKCAGWTTVYCPYAVGWHIRGGSTGKHSRKWMFLNYRNRYLMMIKNDCLINILRDLPQLLIYETGMFFSMLFQMQLIPVIFSVIILLPKFLKKRRYLQKRKQNLPRP